MNWYLLKTKPHAHVTACENLRRQGFDVFLPLIVGTKKDQKKWQIFRYQTTSLSGIFVYGHFNRSRAMEEHQWDERHIQRP